MDRKAACIAQASVCRENARTDPERQEYWIDETIRWLERAVERSGDIADTYEVKDGRLVAKGTFGDGARQPPFRQMDDSEKMLAKLLEDARKLPPGQKRHELLKEIGRFRVKLDVFKERKKSQPAK
jgi:hypothetical protein